MVHSPDYRNLETAARNVRPPRLPFYDHIIDPVVVEPIVDRQFASLRHGDAADQKAFFEGFCASLIELGYDTISEEVCVTQVLPAGGALLHEGAGPIQSRADFEDYPWAEVAERFWAVAEPRFEALRAAMPAGMKAVGGVGNGVFEISEDLVGFEQLCFMEVDDPPLFAELYQRIGDLLIELWTKLLQRHGDLFCVCRIGDDLGFKTSTLLSPTTLIEHVIGQYRRIIPVIHASGKTYLQHSCGYIFDVMDAWIEAGVDAKHSNEEAVAPFDEWIERYGDRIALFGGIDTDRLCRMELDALYEFVLDEATRFRGKANGYALGSGNSVPDYVPPEGFLAMNRAGRELRRREARGG